MKSIYIFMFFLISSCAYINPEKKRKEQVEKYSNYIMSNRLKFENLTTTILNNEYVQSRIGYHIDKNQLNENITDQLSELDILSFSVSKMKCDAFEVEYRTNWTDYPVGQLYLTKDNCNGEQSTKGYYQEEGFIEVWGLGNGWIIWVDSDFI